MITQGEFSYRNRIYEITILFECLYLYVLCTTQLFRVSHDLLELEKAKDWFLVPADA